MKKNKEFGFDSEHHLTQKERDILASAAKKVLGLICRRTKNKLIRTILRGRIEDEIRLALALDSCFHHLL